MNELTHAPAENGVATLPHASGLAQIMAGGRPETAKALIEAIRSCPHVVKDAKNNFHKYSYASADAIIDVGRAAMVQAGLALIPVESSVNGSERTGADRFELVRTFLLAHVSGEMTPLRVVWPIVEEKGRPLDKATGAADTLSLSYLLRDILLMPRVAEGDDVAGRADKPAQKKNPLTAADLEKRLVRCENEMVGARRCSAGELLAAVAEDYASAWGHEPPPFGEWTAPQVERVQACVKRFQAAHKEAAPPVNPAPAPAVAPPAADLVSVEQVDQLTNELNHRKVLWSIVVTTEGLPANWTPEKLTVEQWRIIMGKLTGNGSAARK